MKIRSCFVSNSSSSSFIINLPRFPKDKEDLRSMLDFKSLSDYPSHYYKPSNEEILNELYSSITTAIKEKEILIEQDLTKMGNERLKNFMYDLDIKLKDLVSCSLIDFVKSVNFKNRIVLHYSDDFPFSSAMEHVVCPVIFGNYLIKHENNH